MEFSGESLCTESTRVMGGVGVPVTFDCRQIVTGNPASYEYVRYYTTPLSCYEWMHTYYVLCGTLELLRLLHVAIMPVTLAISLTGIIAVCCDLQPFGIIPCISTVAWDRLCIIPKRSI